MERLFQLVEKYCFQGHTHVPGVFTEGYQFYAPEEIDHEYTLGDGKVMINVGSVGQPRDGDPRSCYVILDDGAAQPQAPAPSVDRATRWRRLTMRLEERPTGVGSKPPADRPDPRDVSPAALRLRVDDPEDLRRARTRPLPGRPAPPGPLSGQATASRLALRPALRSHLKPRFAPR